MQRVILIITTIGVLGCGSAPPPPPAPPPELIAPGADGDTAAPAPEETASGVPPACDNRDDCNNMGVNAVQAKDGAKAIPFLQKACDLENPVGCFNLAALLASDDLGVKDPARSATVYLRACDLGEGTGCLGAGMACYEGSGIGKDAARALGLFERGCTLGEPEACKNAGVLYWQGDDVAKDRDKGLDYFRKGCSGGFQPACDLVKDIEAQLAGADEPSGGGGIAGANLTVGSMSVNDMTVNDLECRLDSMGFMAAMQLVASIAAQKKAMDKCAPKGDAPRVKWTFSGGRAKQVEVEGAASIKIEKCVAIAAGKMESGMDGECAAYFLIGTAAGAAAAYEKAKAGN